MPEFYAYNADTFVIRFNDNATPVSPANVHLKNFAISTTANVVDEDYDISSTHTWEGCVVNGSAHGFAVSGLPTGVVEADPNFADRGDTVFVSDHSNLTQVIIDCIPVQLQGPTITDLGTRYTSV